MNQIRNVKGARDKDGCSHADTEDTADDAAQHFLQRFLYGLFPVSEKEIDHHEDYFLDKEEVIDGAVDEDREDKERSLLFVVNRLDTPEQKREECNYIVEVEEHEVHCLETGECIKERTYDGEVILLPLFFLGRQE